MALNASNVGLIGPGVRETLDNRWLMSYAASVSDELDVYFDTLSQDSIPAHPAYISHLEWEAIGELHTIMPGLTSAEMLRGVHSFNDTIIERPLRAGDQVVSTARVVGVEKRRSGGRLTIKVTTVDGEGELLVTSYTSTIFRDVEVLGEDTIPDIPVVREDDWEIDPIRSETIQISSIAPFVFSECARDYNPIHTDVAVAQEAGLPGLILHGTGTFAIAVSSLVRHESNSRPEQARHFRGRLGAMVPCPSTIELSVYQNRRVANEFRFKVTAADGGNVIDDGFFATLN
jgi:acyl dehydratase